MSSFSIKFVIPRHQQRNVSGQERDKMRSGTVFWFLVQGTETRALIMSGVLGHRVQTYSSNVVF